MSFPSRLRLRRLAVGRFLIATVALAAYSIAAVGVPLPMFQAKDRSQAFPCMDRPCDCKSASACWTSCCCTTPKERLAGARERGIEPPSSLLAAVASRPASKEPAGACCVARGRHPAASDSHVSSRAKGAAVKLARAAKPAAQKHEREASDFVVISAMRECHGLTPLWSSLAAAIAPPPTIGYDFEWNLSGWLRLESESAPSRGPSPAIPPPRA
jgi:hypothetical protein